MILFEMEKNWLARGRPEESGDVAADQPVMSLGEGEEERTLSDSTDLGLVRSTSPGSAASSNDYDGQRWGKNRQVDTNSAGCLGCVTVDDSWERLSISCLGAANGGIVNREAETGLIEALRQPGLLKRGVAAKDDGDADPSVAATTEWGDDGSSGVNEDDRDGVLAMLQRRIWQRLVGLNVRLKLLLASNMLSFVLGLWLGRRGGGAGVAPSAGPSSELVIGS